MKHPVLGQVLACACPPVQPLPKAMVKTAQAVFAVWGSEVLGSLGVNYLTVADWTGLDIETVFRALSPYAQTRARTRETIRDALYAVGASPLGMHPVFFALPIR